MTEKEIDIILEESKMAGTEIIEYTKLMFITVSVFFVFVGTALTLGLAGNTEAWIAMQLLVPFFLVMLTTLEKENKLNSIYMIYNEKRLNFYYKKDLMNWQYFIGSGYYYDRIGVKRTKYYIVPVGIAMFTMIVYIFAVVRLQSCISGTWTVLGLAICKRVVYIVASFSFYLIIVIVLLMSRRSEIKKITGLLQDIRKNYLF